MGRRRITGMCEIGLVKSETATACAGKDISEWRGNDAATEAEVGIGWIGDGEGSGTRRWMEGRIFQKTEEIRKEGRGKEAEERREERQEMVIKQ